MEWVDGWIGELMDDGWMDRGMVGCMMDGEMGRRGDGETG